MSRFALATPLIGLTATVALALSACTSDEPTATPSETAVGDGDASPAEATTDPGDTEPEAEPEPRECTTDGPPEAVTDLTGEDPVAVAIAVASTTHTCSDVVVVAGLDDAWSASLAAPIASTAGAPLLLVRGDDPTAVAETVATLEPFEVVTVGLDDGLDVGGDVEVRAITAPPGDGAALALAVADDLDTGHALGFVADDAGSLAAALSRAAEGLPLLPLPADDVALRELVTDLPPDLRIETIARDEERARALAGRLLDLGVDAEPTGRPRFATDRGEVAWLADPADGAGYAVAAAAAGGRGEVLLPISATAPWHGRERMARLDEVAPERTGVVGTVDAGLATWQLQTVLDAEPLATGAYTLFETERIVAMYGVPGTRALGVLGEQDLEATVPRLLEIAEPYGADGREVLPAFEIITTVASAEAGDRGDYSRRMDPAMLREWVDRAAAEGFYVVLDLQSGRTDFLTQAQEYEELLREPHVGLALDPEWRLAPDERHLRQIGSVEDAEVQQVADWLAGLVRDEQLPQKLLLLHQFRLSMLPDRDTIETGPELATVVHMDGQGSIGSKYATYDAITAGAEDRWLWGWKNFYDEDFPTPTPEEVLALDPLPVYVSYQ
ncbi:MAG TPA: cell wall-binding repeat-containing protein [Egicoccus sp.]|nr:cell wall-binding repeat-containing protein [Egicoccus sp.]HSK22426.1 cell wall-binding repeat-containing protein [Egicoccus sp.]